MPDLLPEFRYLQNDQWLPLPRWCLSFLRLGQAIAGTSLEQSRHVVALALPSRRYSSVFAGIGIVLASTGLCAQRLIYQKFIESREPDTTVIIYNGNKRLKGIIDGFPVIDGQKYVSIRVGKKDIRKVPLATHASRLLVVDRDFKFTDYQHGQTVRATAAILSGAVEDPLAFASNTQLDVVFVAIAGELGSEVSCLQLGIFGSDEVSAGTPQDLLRISRFLGAESYRSEIYTVSASPDEELDARIVRPAVVVFSDASGYLRHHAKWPRSHHLVLFDRTQRAFGDAATNINQRYIRRLGNSMLSGVDLPSGIEALSFEESIP